MTDFDLFGDDNPLGKPERAELGAISNNPRKKGDRSDTQARRNEVMLLARGGMSQKEIVDRLQADFPNIDAPMVSNDLAYIAKQTLESYSNADGNALMADMMQDYVQVRRVLFSIMADTDTKAGDRVSASKAMLQLSNDFRGFLVTAKIISATEARGNKSDDAVRQLLERMDKSEDNSDLYSLFNKEQPL